MAKGYKVSENVADLLVDWMTGKIDQDDFDESLDEMASYHDDVYSSVDSYLAGIA